MVNSDNPDSGDWQKPLFNSSATIWDQFKPVRRWRRRLVSLFYRFPDLGLFGFIPLRSHILICGYPRGGTTLLLMMLEHAYLQARCFGREISGWRAAAYSWRNHAVMISKVPWDVEKLFMLQNFYKNRPANLFPVLLIRDPRDVLTSVIKSQSNEYFLDIPTWKRTHAFVTFYRQHPEVLTLRYEDLVTDPDTAQSRIEEFTGEKAQRRMADYYLDPREDFDTHPLNGVRPPDKKSIGKWRKPEHRERIQYLLEELPELPRILIDMGYENDKEWRQQYS